MWASLGLGLLFGLLIVASAAGNLLVVAAILTERRLRRAKENLFLVSLAVSDLLVAVLVMLFAAVNDILGQWPFGAVYCRLWVVFDIALCTASILNMCAIAFDRYAHISDPMKYQSWVRRSRIGWSILALWILAASIGSLHMALGNSKSASVAPRPLLNGSRAANASPPACQLQLRPTFAIASSVVSFFLPASLMLFAYYKLYRCARRHLRSIKGQIRAVTESLLAQTKRLSCPNPHGMEEPASTLASEHKARVTLGALMGIFLVCWLPFFIVNIARSLAGDAVPHGLFLAVTWLGYANSALNPLIYSVFNRDFRNAYRNIVKLVFRGHRLPLGELSSGCSPFRGRRHRKAKPWREYHSMTNLGTERESYGSARRRAETTTLLRPPDAPAAPKRSRSTGTLPSDE